VSAIGQVPAGGKNNSYHIGALPRPPLRRSRYDRSNKDLAPILQPAFLCYAS
jgi:hypothetical protein